MVLFILFGVLFLCFSQTVNMPAENTSSNKLARKPRTSGPLATTEMRIITQPEPVWSNKECQQEANLSPNTSGVNIPANGDRPKWSKKKNLRQTCVENVNLIGKRPKESDKKMEDKDYTEVKDERPASSAMTPHTTDDVIMSTTSDSRRVGVAEDGQSFPLPPRFNMVAANQGPPSNAGWLPVWPSVMPVTRPINTVFVPYPVPVPLPLPVPIPVPVDEEMMVVAFKRKATVDSLVGDREKRRVDHRKQNHLTSSAASPLATTASLMTPSSLRNQSSGS